MFIDIKIVVQFPFRNRANSGKSNSGRCRTVTPSFKEFINYAS